MPAAGRANLALYNGLNGLVRQVVAKTRVLRCFYDLMGSVLVFRRPK